MKPFDVVLADKKNVLQFNILTVCNSKAPQLNQIDEEKCKKFNWNEILKKYIEGKIITATTNVFDTAS